MITMRPLALAGVTDRGTLYGAHSMRAGALRPDRRTCNPATIEDRARVSARIAHHVRSPGRSSRAAADGAAGSAARAGAPVAPNRVAHRTDRGDRGGVVRRLHSRTPAPHRGR